VNTNDFPDYYASLFEVLFGKSGRAYVIGHLVSFRRDCQPKCDFDRKSIW